MTVTTSQVTTLLENVLFEQPSIATAQAASWTAIANLNPNTQTVAGLAASMASSQEATIAQQVIQYYQAALGRVPSAFEINYYVAIAEQGLNATQIASGVSAVSNSVWAGIAADFTSSAEFQKDFGLTGGVTASNEALIVTGFYSNILGRSPSLSEINYYVAQLNAGANVSVLLQEFTESPEYQAKADATIQANLTNNGVNAVTTVNNGGNPQPQSGPAIGSLPTATAQKVNLSTSVDTLAPTGNTIVNALLDGTAGSTDSTLTALDSIDGSGGSVTLNITNAGNAIATLPSSVTLKNLAAIDFTSAVGVTYNAANLTNVTGLKLLDVVQSNGVDTIIVGSGTAATVIDSDTAVAAATVDVAAVDSAVTVTSAGGATVDGGSTVTITAAGNVVVGAVTPGTTSAPTGAITVTDSALGGAAIQIDGGTTVTVTATDKTGGAGDTITIGGTTAPTGAVTVNESLSLKAAATGGAITVHGGTVDTITITASQSTLDGATKTTVGAVTVDGGKATTSVVITETPASTGVLAVKAVPAVAATDVVTFVAMAANDTITIDGLTFTAAKALTAAQAASAFAGLTEGALAGSAASSLGSYSGTFTSGNSYSSGAVSGSTVTFSDASGNGGLTTADSIGGVAGTLADVTTAGTVAIPGVTGVPYIVDGTFTIADTAYATGTNTIASVSVSGFSGGSVKSDALATLNLANGTGTVTVYDHTAKSLALTLNNVDGAVSLDGVAGTYTTLAITTATADSTVALTASGVTALTVSGTNEVDLHTGSTFTALKTVTVSGAAGISLDGSALANLTDVNASASSGTNTVILDGTKATYEGGSGNDYVILGTSAPTKAISGGTGTDTVGIGEALAVSASTTSAFASDVTGFENLVINTISATGTVNVATLGNFTSVAVDGVAAGDTLTLSGFATGGTLVITDNAGAGGDYTLTNTAWTSTAPAASVNIDMTSDAASLTNAGTVTAANVTAIKITATDTSTTDAAGTITDTLTVAATSATSITLTGNANVHLGVASDTALTTIDGHALTGSLTVITAGTVAETVTGSSTAANTLYSLGGSVADTLIGGAKADTFVANSGLDTLTGGGGNDTFIVGVSSSATGVLTAAGSANVNSYATITDAHAGNVIQLGTGATLAASFSTAKVSLGGTAVFQDYANAAISATAASSHAADWFQYGGDTYIVEHNGASTSAFTNGTDVIVKLTGIHDLSTASFSAGTGSIVLHS